MDWDLLGRTSCRKKNKQRQTKPYQELSPVETDYISAVLQFNNTYVFNLLFEWTSLNSYHEEVSRNERNN